jgi:4-hydroxybenzoate polyprenyltransferase
MDRARNHIRSEIPGASPTIAKHQNNSAGFTDLNVPIVVEVDATLNKQTLIIESLTILLNKRPERLFVVPVWFLMGHERLQQEIDRRIPIDAYPMPYRAEVLEYLRKQLAKGRTVVLTTGTDKQLARRVAKDLRISAGIMTDGSCGTPAPKLKRECLVRGLGHKGFDYVGNRSGDLAVWSAARKVVLINPSAQLLRMVSKVTEVQGVFEDRRARTRDYWNALRPTHWLKNCLVFVALYDGHIFNEPVLLGKAFLAFVALCLCTSSGYLVNDVFDIRADRRHPQKRQRPFASGLLPLSYAITMAPALLVMSCALSVLVSPVLLGTVLIYIALSLTYSLYLKTVVLLDVIVLAGLYTLRILSGAAVTGEWPSEWLLASSMFLFASLALVKRYDELVVMRSVDGDHTKARSYSGSDAELLASMGAASGFAAILTFVLYIWHSSAQLYGRHEVVWFLCPLLLYWLAHIWLTAHGGRLREDPVVFALHDRTSRNLLVLMSIDALLAA